MSRAKNFSIWTEAGYELFAAEGPDGIQIERLARILKLNKSSFYHYFGYLERYIKELVALHRQKADIYLIELKQISSIDPNYLELLVKHKTAIMFQVHLIRIKHNALFQSIATHIDQQVDKVLSQMWGDYLGLREYPQLAIRYFNIVRDMFYARLSYRNFNYPFLHNLMNEARVVMTQITDSKTASEGAKIAHLT